MSKKSYRIWIYFILAMVLSLSLVGRIFWENTFGSVTRYAKKGIVTVDTKELENKMYSLNGEWSFYPDEFISSVNFYKPSQKYIQVPSNWESYFSNTKNKSFGYGTYHLKLYVPKDERRFAIHLVSIHSASKIFVNNKLLYESGTVGRNEKESLPKNIPKTLLFNKPESKETIDLFIQVSNFHDVRSGGISREILFGDANMLMDNMNISNSLEVITLAILILMVFLLLGLFIFVKPQKELLFVVLILFNFSLLFMIGLGEKLLHHWIDITYDMNVRLVNISVLIISLLFLSLITKGFSSDSKIRIKWLIRLELFCVLICIFLPVKVVHRLSNIFVVFLMISLFLTFIVSIKRIEKSVPTQSFFLIALFTLMIHLSIWFYSFLTGSVYIYYPFDVLISIFCLMFTWLKHYQGVYTKMEELNISLIYAMESKNSFLSRVAIKLRKPIKEVDNLIGNIVIQAENSTDTELVENLSMLEEANQDILILVNNMVELSNSEFSLKNDFVEPLSISKKINYCTSIVTKNEFYQDIDVRVDIDYSIDLIYGNVRHFVQLIFQVLFIAKRIIPLGNLVFTTEKTSEKKTALNIYFTECFISKDQLLIMNMSLRDLMEDDTLFESMYGIEMSLLHSLARLQGGYLSVKQLSNGMSMQFTFDTAPKLEIYEKECLEIVELDDSQINSKKRVILVVSSDMKQLLALRTMLENKETLVIVTNCTTDALNYIKKYNIDLVICDTILDNTTGFSFVNDVRKGNTITQLPILLIVSTNKYKVELNEVYRSGANDYMEKPIDAVELSAKVKILIGMKKNIEQAIHFEASWLQAQIEPHFLFNTLNTIISLSSEDEDKMDEVFEAFMTLLHSKYHYDNEGIITLEEELSLVESYLLIEKTRYGDKLHINWDVDETLDLKQISIISLSIQPIVENAIKHGVLPQQGPGILSIQVKRANESRVVVVIKDDGCGTDKTMSEFLHMRYQKLPIGIGLTNTYYRFKKIMGEELIFESGVGKGTKVSFYLDY